MKIYEIIDEENSLSAGVLLYYEREGAFIIELREELDEWSAPLMLASFVKKGIYTIPRDISLAWVRERVVPSSRQNINDILANHGLKAYDEMRILEISRGKCSQDSMYIKKLEELPGYVSLRMQKNIVECFISDDESLICFFADDTVRRITIDELPDKDIAQKLKGNRQLYESCKVGTGGYSISFNDSIDIPSAALYISGTAVPVKLSDFTSFVQKNVLDTTQSCELLGCTRQNISYMVNKSLLNPLREEVKGNLYLKGDLLQNRW